MATCIIALLFMFPQSAFSQKLSGEEIMRKVDRRDEGSDLTSASTFSLINKRGQKRVRQIRRFWKNYKGEDGFDEKILIYFDKPTDVKNTSFLSWTYADPAKDDDQWLYLPALRKTKRIATSDKSGSFMGSDFSYYDMTKRELDDYDYRLLKEPVVNGIKTWLIESIPRSKEVIDESGYEKSVIFVRQDNYVVIRAVNWMKKGNRLKYMEVKKLELIDNVWVATETWMTTKKGKITLHKTILKQSNVKFNRKLDENLFTVRRLEKGL